MKFIIKCDDVKVNWKKKSFDIQNYYDTILRECITEDQFDFAICYMQDNIYLFFKNTFSIPEYLTFKLCKGTKYVDCELEHDYCDCCGGEVSIWSDNIPKNNK